MLGYDPFILLNAYAGSVVPGLPPEISGIFRKKSLAMPPEFTFPMHCGHAPNCIVMVGCGGTGSELLPKILQYLVARQKSLQIPVLPILIIDGDEVEEKNVSRQRFTLSDVGKNKAEALSERYSDVFGVQITSYPSYVKPNELFGLVQSFWKSSKAQNHPITKFSSMIHAVPIFIGAVDNNRARLAILSAHYQISGSVWIDSGNEDHYGQAILGTNTRTTYDTHYVYQETTEPGSLFVKHYSEMNLGVPLCAPEYLPNFFDLHPEQFLAIPKDPETPAGICAQNVVNNPQTIQANTYSAMAAFILFTQVTERKIRVSSISFDSLNGGARSEPISFLSLEQGLKKIKESRKFLLDFFNGIHLKKRPLNDNEWSATLGFSLPGYAQTLDIVV